MQGDSRVEPSAGTFAALSAPVLPELAHPIFDEATFASVASVVSPAAVSSYIKTLAERCDSLLRQLRVSPPLLADTRDLAAAAHALGGSAGLFGFQRLAIAAYNYERLLEIASPSTPSAAVDLIAVMETSLFEMHQHLRRYDQATQGQSETT